MARVTVTAADIAQGRVAAVQAEAAVRYGPVLHGAMPVGDRMEAGVHLAGPDAARAALQEQHHRLSSDLGWWPVLGHGLGVALLNADDPLHARQRRAWAPLFTARSHARFASTLHTAIDAALAQWPDDEPFDAWASMRALAFDAVARGIAGLPADCIERAGPALCDVLDGRSGAPDDGAMARASAGRSAFLRLLHDAVARARADTSPAGLLGLLLQAGEEDEAIVAQLAILLVAGHETGATYNARGLEALARDATLSRRIAAELGAAGGLAAGAEAAPEVLARSPALHGLFLETGRLYPPLVNLPRVAREALELDGVHIPAGTRIAIAVGAVQRLPGLYADPERFDVDRHAGAHAPGGRPYDYLAFAGGQRMCLGQRTAELEFKSIVARVLGAFELGLVDRDANPHAGFWNARPARPLQLVARRRAR